MPALFSGCRPSTTREISRLYRLEKLPTAENLEIIRSKLESTDPSLRAAAVHLLGRMRAPDAVEVAVESLSDPSERVRSTAARSLTDLKDPIAVASLRSRLAEDPVAEVRLHAALALEAIGGAEAREGLLVALADPSDPVRLAAVRGLARLGPGENVDSLVRLLAEDQAWEIRVEVAEALSHAATPEAAAALDAARLDPNEFVRGAAARALRDVLERLAAAPAPAVEALAGGRSVVYCHLRLDARAPAAPALSRIT